MFGGSLGGVCGAALTPFPLQALGSQGHVSAEVEAGTRRRVQALRGGQAQGKERVLRRLLGLVCDPRPCLHPNLRLPA